MSDKQIENPSAFPLSHQVNINKEIYQDAQLGMTLRDYFAGQAIAGPSIRTIGSHEGLATEAYRLADAMLKERLK